MPTVDRTLVERRIYCIPTNPGNWSDDAPIRPSRSQSKRYDSARRNVKTNMRRQTIGVIGLVALGLVATARTGSGQELRPNLVAMPASEFQIGTVNGVTLLRFGTVSWNNGLGPMEIEAGNVSTAGRDVYQNVYNSDGTKTSYPAGTYEYHPDHQHFHFENYALYTLKQVGAPGQSAKTSQKTSFCLMDTNRISGNRSAAYVTCSSSVQGITVGWADRYGPTLPGQSFDITNSPNADYDLTLSVDPQDRFLETSESDNVSCVRVRLGTTSQGRTVTSLGTCGGVSISSMTPTSLKQGTSIQVTITGSGFAAGMAVGFENGSGPAPSASNVIVDSPTQIRATVSLNKNGGGKAPRIWDLRVGSAVLPRALTITK